MTLNLTARVLPKFPARVAAGVGIAVTKVNGVWTFAMTGANVASQAVTDPVNTEVFLEMPDGTIAKSSLSAVLAATTVQQTGRRNAFINGGFQVNQYRKPAADMIAATRQFLQADRWGFKSSAGTLSFIGQNTYPNTPPDRRSFNSVQITGNAGMGTLDIDQRIERVNVEPLSKGPVTFSAYIVPLAGGGQTAFTPTLFVECPTALDNWAASNVRNNGGAGDGLQSCPVGAWTKVTWSADISGYVDLDKGLGFRLRIPAANLGAGMGILLTEFQVEPVNAVGDAPSLFEAVDFASTLAACQRYFQKSFPYATKPAQNVGNAAGALAGVQVVAAATAQAVMMAPRFAAVMRTTPTIVTFNPNAANAEVRNVTVPADCSATAVTATGDDGFVVLTTTAAGSAVGQRNHVHFTADAEL